MKKIVIFRGKSTAGKSTLSYELAKVLPGWIYVDHWKIKEMFDPLNLKDRKPINKAAKKAMLSIMRTSMRELHCSIILQEVTQAVLKQRLRSDLNDYKLYSFFLTVDYKDVEKRDKEREKPTCGFGTKKLSQAEFEAQLPLPDKCDIVINTSKQSIEKTIDIILKHIGEKKKKHLFAHLIRKVH